MAARGRRGLGFRGRERQRLGACFIEGAGVARSGDGNGHSDGDVTVPYEEDEAGLGLGRTGKKTGRGRKEGEEERRVFGPILFFSFDFSLSTEN